MEFKRIFDFNKLIGTFYQGSINVSFDDLVKVFGEPDQDMGGGKTDAEWDIEFEDGTIATIYNWKNGKNYLGEEGLDVEDIDEWHVGGRNSKALRMVKKVLREI